MYTSMADRYINSLQEFLNRNDLTDDQRREAEQELQLTLETTA